MSGSSRSWTSAPALVLVVMTLIAAGLAGIASVVLPLGATLVLAALPLAALTALFLRRVLIFRSPRPSAEPADAGVQAESSATRELRVSRALFYLGTLTIGLTGLRPGLGLTVGELFLILAFIGCAFAALRGTPLVRLPP